MRQFNAFIKKEWMEQSRTNKLLILGIVSVVFGIMSPAVAKLTPVIFEAMSQSLSDQGISSIQLGEVTAITSWQQFYKNISTLMIVFVVMASGNITNEYQKGTLVNIVTKGMPRHKILISKLFVQVVIWTLSYFITFFTTYIYTIYYWDNSVVKYCFLAALLPYLFGLWLIAFIFLASTISNNNISVLLFVGGAVALCYLLGIAPDLKEYLPTTLLSAGNLLTGASLPEDFVKATVVTAFTGMVAILVSISTFNKKKL
ncbi:MAG: ABC transporter permease [Lachnospiraceae bacterium]|nr:ABC transporter permease [Lachnospiraceae bacterium]